MFDVKIFRKTQNDQLKIASHLLDEMLEEVAMMNPDKLAFNIQLKNVNPWATIDTMTILSMMLSRGYKNVSVSNSDNARWAAEGWRDITFTI